jgi:ribose 1,5-bisphosphokinase PhnN
MPCEPVLLIIGPSGVGKSTVARFLERRGLARICPTWTTRPRRRDELGTCPEHRFVTDAEFAQLEAAGFFLATGRHPGLPHRYGLPRVTAGRPLPLVVGRARLATAIDGLSVLTYLLVAGLPTLARRLSSRGVTADEAAARMAAAADELRAGRAVSSRQFDASRDVIELCAAVEAALAQDVPIRSDRPGAAA